MAKTVAEFKAAFLTIRKPKLPKGLKNADKDLLEEDVRYVAQPGNPGDTNWNKSTATTRFATRTAELHADPATKQYVVDLAAYKLGKHADDAKLGMWLTQVPPEVRDAAVAKLVPRDLTDPYVQRALAKAAKSGNRGRADLIFARDPTGTVDHALSQRAAAAGDDVKQQQWLDAIPQTPEANRLIVAKVVALGDVTMLPRVTDSLRQIIKDPVAVRAVAAQNPAFFVKTVLPALKADPNLPGLLADPELRTLLQEDAPAEWAKLVAATPMLEFIDGLADTVEGDKPGAVKAVFDAVVNNVGIELAYFTNSLFSNREILGGGTDADRKKHAKKKEEAEEKGELYPDIPASQCHDVVHTLELLAQSFPGVKPGIKPIYIKGMLLTKPLGAIGAKGILDSSFPGNVFGEDGVATGQVLFTGNERGQQSHTWLEIDGVPYDPVLGTSGPDVKASVANEFVWTVPDRVGKGAGGWYVVKDPALKAAPNAMGFDTGYYLTQDPTPYLKDGERDRIDTPHDYD